MAQEDEPDVFSSKIYINLLVYLFSLSLVLILTIVMILWHLVLTVCQALY